MAKLEDAVDTKNVDGEIAPFNINQIDGMQGETGNFPEQSSNGDNSLIDTDGIEIPDAPVEPVGPAHPITPLMAEHIVDVVFGGGYLFYGEGHEHWKNTDKKKEILVPMLVMWVNTIPELAEFVYQAEAQGAPIVLIGMVVADVLKSKQINKKAKTQKQQEAATLYDGLLEANGLK